MISIPDLGIGICSALLVVFTIPTLLNRSAKVPRWTSSMPVALCLSGMIPFMAMEQLWLTVCTLSGQAIIWFAIAAWRTTK